MKHEIVPLDKATQVFQSCLWNKALNIFVYYGNSSTQLGWMQKSKWETEAMSAN